MGDVRLRRIVRSERNTDAPVPGWAFSYVIEPSKLRMVSPMYNLGDGLTHRCGTNVGQDPRPKLVLRRPQNNS